MNIKYKDLIHVLLPFIAQWADSASRQGMCLIIVLSQQFDHDPETEKVQNNVQYIQMHSI